MKKLRKKFSAHFKEQLKKRYNKIPSTNFIANEFNLRAHNSETVSPRGGPEVAQWIILPEIR